jgi:DNA-binding NarL/FixJ family response regulator
VLGKITLLRRHMSRIPLVLLSDSDDVDDIIEAMEQGVRGYITTNLEPSEAAAALQCVAAGRHVRAGQCGDQGRAGPAERTEAVDQV